MQYYSSWSGTTFFVLSSIAYYVSAAAKSGNSTSTPPFTNNTLSLLQSPLVSSSLSINLLSTGSVSNASSSSNSSSSALPQVTLGFITSIIIQSGTAVKEPIITSGGSLITILLVTTTIGSSQAILSVSSVSSQIVALIPVINSWKLNPKVLKIDTLNTVKDLKSEVESLISDLGSDSSFKPCGSKKKRGLLGSIISDIVDTLSCVDKGLNELEIHIDANHVDINGIITDLKSDTKDLTDNKDHDSKSKPSSKSTSLSSCTSMETALRVTDICVPTIYTTSGSRFSTTTCSPLITITTKGCDVTGTTTTIYSSSSSASRILCARGTCGDSCPPGGGPLSGASMGVIATTEDCSLILTRTTAVLPTARSSTIANSKRAFFSDLLDYNNTLVDSSSSLVERALPDVTPPYTNYLAFLSQQIVWVSQKEVTSGHWYQYPIYGRGAVGVNGLYGCTAVVIVSTKGVYLSHIWEVPVFKTNDDKELITDDAFFEASVFNTLRDGAENVQSITALIGTNAQPGVLNAIYAPRVFVITPLANEYDRVWEGITTRYRYQDRIQRLANQIVGIIPGSLGVIMGYTPDEAQRSLENHNTAGRAILEVDPFQSWLTTPDTDLDSSGMQIGRWRLWLEEKPMRYHDFYVPDNKSPSGTLQQRDVGYPNPCSGHISTSINSSGASISSSGASGGTGGKHGSKSSSRSKSVSGHTSSSISSSGVLGGTGGKHGTKSSSRSKSVPTAHSIISHPPVTSCTLLSDCGNPPQKDKIGGLGCYSLGSPKFILDDEADKHINEFCGDKSMNSRRPGPVTDFLRYYNIKSNDEVLFEISYPKNTYIGSNDHISVNDCRLILKMILDGCDGNNPDNPINLKHGGWASYTWDPDNNPDRKAQFSIKPQQNQANPTCFTSSFGRWVNARNGTSAAADFCRNTLYDTARPNGTRVTKDFFVNTTRLTLTARWFDNWSLGPNDCLDAFTKIFDGCDGNDPGGNPENLKFGGQVLTGGPSDSEVLFVAIPQASLAFPIGIFNSTASCTASEPSPNNPGIMGKYQMLKAVNDYCVRNQGMESPPTMQANGGTGQLCLLSETSCLTTAGPEQNGINYRDYNDIEISVTPVAECDHPKLSVNECKETMANFAFYCIPSSGVCYKGQIVADYADCPADQYAFGGAVRKNCFDYTVQYYNIE